MTEATAILIGGTLLVPLLQILKRAFHLGGNAIRWIAVGFSVVIASAVMLWNGQVVFSDPSTLMTAGAAILGVSQIIYGALKNKMNLSEPTSP